MVYQGTIETVTCPKCQNPIVRPKGASSWHWCGAEVPKTEDK